MCDHGGHGVCLRGLVEGGEVKDGIGGTFQFH